MEMHDEVFNVTMVTM